VNCALQFVGLETQHTTPETIDSHIKLINNLIIFDANKHILIITSIFFAIISLQTFGKGGFIRFNRELL